MTAKPVRRMLRTELQQPHSQQGQPQHGQPTVGGAVSWLAVLCLVLLPSADPSVAAQVLTEGPAAGVDAREGSTASSPAPFSFDPAGLALRDGLGAEGLRQLARELLFNGGESALEEAAARLTRRVSPGEVTWDFSSPLPVAGVFDASQGADAASSEHRQVANACRAAARSKVAQHNCELVVEAQTAQAERSDFQR